MYEEQLVYIDSSYMMFYGGAAVLALVACIYLLFRRSNAIVPGINPPLRLRRWTAAFFAVMFLSHLWWWLIIHYALIGDLWLNFMVAASLDCLMVVPTLMAVMVVMLQDRRRPLWPIAAIQVPVVAFFAVCIPQRSNTIVPLIQYYFLFLGVGFIIYMVLALRQYRLWLCDNYADLEHKEVWQSFVVFAIILLGYAIYLLDIGELLYEYVMEVINIVLICYLLWRVETLSDLSIAESDAEEETDTTEKVEDNDLSIRNRSTSAALLAKNIGPLLKQHCEEPQLYLQHDISAMQLAKLIGTNRLYLSKHFASQGITYSTYINGLRIQHFINLYHEAVATHQPITVRQLAHKSGFHSYSTFNAAFKQSMGMTASEWMSSES